jgi:hypothetical protein
VWRRKRVERTSMAVEAGAEKEGARGVDPAAVGEAVGETPAWTQHRWRQRSIKADMEEERARSVDRPTMVDEAPVWTRWW